jgi:hypothetical protein
LQFSLHAASPETFGYTLLDYVFENRVLRRIFGYGGGEWREETAHEELHKSYASPDIIRVIKSSRMSCVGM